MVYAEMLMKGRLRWRCGLVMVGVVPVGFAQAHARRAASGAAKVVEPTGPVVVIDTSMGRITCRLYEKQAPVTVANFVGLAEGSKDWTDPATDKMVQGKGFYDGTGMVGISDGVMAGDRMGMLAWDGGRSVSDGEEWVGI